MPELNIDTLIHDFVGVGSELIPIKANGRRTVAVYRQISNEGCDRIIKISRFDKSIYSVNKYFADHPNMCDSLFYCQPEILLLCRYCDLLIVVYPFTEYCPISWSDLRSQTTTCDLVRAIADFNSTVSSSSADLSHLSGVRLKEYRLSLTLDKLSAVFSSWSRDKCEHYFELAQTSYHSLLEYTCTIGGVSNCESVLSHNDLVPKNILKPIANHQKYTFIDFDDACIAPVGTDLRFIIAANYLQADLLDRIYRISSVYTDYYHSYLSSKHITASRVYFNAFMGYVDAWLNIHLRARTRFDERRFLGCLTVCERLKNL